MRRQMASDGSSVDNEKNDWNVAGEQTRIVGWASCDVDVLEESS